MIVQNKEINRKMTNKIMAIVLLLSGAAGIYFIIRMAMKGQKELKGGGKRK